jgi:hypothetical protein
VSPNPYAEIFYLINHIVEIKMSNTKGDGENISRRGKIDLFVRYCGA